MTALQSSLKRYKAIAKSTEISRYGYWSVTYSCAPGVDLTVMVATLGITEQQARTLAAHALFITTGQEVI